MKQRSVVTIGTFDGVHQGHKAILKETCRQAAALGAVPVAVTFDRPPRLFFFPSPESALLSTVQEKEKLLEAQGIRKVVTLHFDGQFAKISARSFFEGTVIGKLKAHAVVVGYNFGFGKNREGDTRQLEQLCREHSIGLTVVEPVCLRHVPVSSGRIRDALKQGELEKANHMLGLPYFLTGRVVRGKGLGSRIGFPTANVGVPAEKIVPEGVFAVRVSILGEKKIWAGMCNVGFCPTVLSASPPSKRTVEAHLFGFSGDLRGKDLKVDLVKKIRNETRFPSVEELVLQLKRDALRAGKIIAEDSKEIRCVAE